jgi:hypothetical protein
MDWDTGFLPGRDWVNVPVEIDGRSVGVVRLDLIPGRQIPATAACRLCGAARYEDTLADACEGVPWLMAHLWDGHRVQCEDSDLRRSDREYVPSPLPAVEGVKAGTNG